MRNLFTAAAWFGIGLAGAGGALAQPTAAPGYTVNVFATGQNGISKPDSILVLDDHVWIGYGNNAAPDGSSGQSNIVEYNLRGQVLRNLVVQGHNDGLRFNPYTHRIWAMQNEDAIPNVVAIDPLTGLMSQPLSLKTVNGGGYDDMAFFHGQTFVSASNPALNANGVNIHPAIVSLVRSGNVYVPQTVLTGDSPAVNTVTGRPSRLNLTDPDSLTETPDGNLLMTDQGDAQLILLRLNGTRGPLISQIPLQNGVQVDDTVFATSTAGTIYVSDTPANTIYAIHSRTFRIGHAFSAAVPTSGTPYVSETYLDSGTTIPIVTGLQGPHGMAFRPR